MTGKELFERHVNTLEEEARHDLRPDAESAKELAYIRSEFGVSVYIYAEEARELQ